MYQRIFKPGQPVVKGNIAVFKCPSKGCKSQTFIESQDGSVKCECGENVIVLNPNHLFGHTVPSPYKFMERGKHYEQLEGTNKDRLAILLTYLTKTSYISEKQELYKQYTRKLLFNNTVKIPDKDVIEDISYLLKEFGIPHKVIGEAIFIDHYKSYYKA